jgi:S-DNA-T family DNA segregation ATPase FtsK/SpoIIIE
MLPAMAAGLVRVWACDPKLMELAFGRALFDRYGRYAADPADIADLLEDAVGQMQARARRFAGKQREHTPTPEFPFIVVLVDEIAFLTAYQSDRKLKDRILAALATLTTQGRVVGYCVVAALQDPRKEVLNIRNLFPDKIALRLDEPAQVDMVLGDGAREATSGRPKKLSTATWTATSRVRLAGGVPPPSGITRTPSGLSASGSGLTLSSRSPRPM